MHGMDRGNVKNALNTLSIAGWCLKMCVQFLSEMEDSQCINKDSHEEHHAGKE